MSDLKDFVIENGVLKKYVGTDANVTIPEEVFQIGPNAFKNNKNIRIVEYIDIPKCLPAADLVVCRSGASTLSELQALGKPSVLIPSPYVTENHQYHNAMALVNKDAAVILEEKDLTADTLTEKVNALLSDRASLEKIGDNAKKMAVLDSTERIYKTLCEIVK